MPENTTTMTGEQVFMAGYVQTSIKHRMVGRTPPGTDPREVLYEARMREYRGTKHEAQWAKDMRRWVHRLGASGCLDHYARVYASGDDRLELTPQQWEDFKKAGGATALR